MPCHHKPQHFKLAANGLLDMEIVLEKLMAKQKVLKLPPVRTTDTHLKMYTFLWFFCLLKTVSPGSFNR